MKKRFAILSVLLAGLLFALTACSAGESTLLARPPKAEQLSYTDSDGEGVQTLRASVGEFSARFAAAAYAEGGKEENVAVSPVNAYLALSLAAACAGGKTREEILSALSTTYSALEENYALLYRSVGARVDAGEMGSVSLAQSVWLQEGIPFEEDCVRLLAEKFFGYSYAADFAGNNARANLAVREFVKNKTKGLIDRDFQLGADTVFAIVSALHCKDVWNLFGDDLPYAEGTRFFTSRSGERKEIKLLQSTYRPGRVYEGENFVHFSTVTHHNLKLKFLLPKEGYSVDDVFTAANLAEANAVSDYAATDDVNKIRYYTRCLFPAYKASFDGNVDGILREMGIRSLFDVSSCDLTPLLGSASLGSAVCAGVSHSVKLSVNRKGIEGASVFVIPGAGAPGPDEYTVKYEDFVIDRAFGYLITDGYDVPVFAGVVGEA